jgi:hypothetical protein
MIKQTALLLSIVLGSCFVCRGDELADLQAQRIETLQQAVGLIEPQYRQGVATIHQLLDAQAALLDAKLEIALTHEERTEVLTQQLKLSASAEKAADGRFRAGAATASEFLLAKAARLRVEIMLAKEKKPGVEDSSALGRGDPAGRHLAEVNALPQHFMSRPPTIEELAELLNVQTYAGQFRLDGACTKFRFVVEGHRDGKQVFLASSGDVLDGQEKATIGPAVGSYRVQILDLDIVRPARREKNYNQLDVQIGVERSGGSRAVTNVSKNTFDLGLLKYSNAEFTNMKPFLQESLVVRPGEKAEIFRIDLPTVLDIDTGQPSATAPKGYIAGYFISEARK